MGFPAARRGGGDANRRPRLGCGCPASTHGRAAALGSGSPGAHGSGQAGGPGGAVARPQWRGGSGPGGARRGPDARSGAASPSPMRSRRSREWRSGEALPRARGDAEVAPPVASRLGPRRRSRVGGLGAWAHSGAWPRPGGRPPARGLDLQAGMGEAPPASPFSAGASPSQGGTFPAARPCRPRRRQRPSGAGRLARRLGITQSRRTVQRRHGGPASRNPFARARSRG